MIAAVQVLDRWQRAGLWLGCVGGVLAVVGWTTDADAFHRAWLLGFTTWLGLPLGAVGFCMLHAVCGGDWGRALAATLSAMTRTMWWMLLLFVPLLWDLQALYPWARPGFADDPEVAHQAPYMNATGYALRGFAFLLLWAVLGRLVLAASPRWRGRLGAGGLIVYTLTGTLAALDWIMSMDPQWTSRVFGIMWLVGQGLAALAAAVAVTAWVASRPDGPRLEKKVLRDLGNLLLAFLMLWSYLEFMQFLIIWNGNLPHSAPWYLERIEGAWLWVTLAQALLHFLLPFLLLLFRANKESPRRLAAIAAWLLLMRGLDDGWNVGPGLGHGLHWLDVVVPVAMGGLLLFLCCRRLRPWLPALQPDAADAPEEP